MHLILLRHTQTATGDAVCYGDSDVPLLDNPEKEMLESAMGLPPFHCIYTSPLSRCMRLANVAAARANLPVEADERLKEMHFGRWQGLRWDDVPRIELDEWAAHFDTARPHGGESVVDLRERLRGFLKDLSVRFAADRRILLVTHAGVIRSVLTIIGQTNGDETDERHHQIDYAQWCEIEYSEK